MVITWEDLHNPKDLDLLKGEKERKPIREMERDYKDKCPYLCKVGDFSYFCGLVGNKKGERAAVSDEILGLLLGEEMGPCNKIYRSLQSVNQLSLHCFDRWGDCCYVVGSLVAPLQTYIQHMAPEKVE